jgi:excisionase family DNA binding protein
LEHQPLSGLADKLLADLMRQCIADGSISRFKVSPPPPRQTKQGAQDLPTYLRGLKRRMRSAEVARLLQINRERLYIRVRSEEVPAHRDGRRWKFDPAEIADWLEEQDRRSQLPDPGDGTPPGDATTDARKS